MNNKLSVFISYARLDGREYAERLYEGLTKHGIHVWRDERSLSPFQDFSGEIEKAIESASHIIACLSPSIGERQDSFVRRELIYALGWDKPIIPLLLPGFDKRRVPTLVNHLTWIPFENFEADFPLLLERLEQQNLQPAPAPVSVDPFQPYLKELYQEIVDFLNNTVFSFISLQSKPTPDGVAASQAVKARALPAGFVGLKIRPSADELAESQMFTGLHEAFEHYRGQVLLLGEPGGGKTTTLMAFARETVVRRLEDPSLPLPIVAPIASWSVERQPSILDWLSEIVKLDADELRNIVQNGRALLLLDGLDELGQSFSQQNAETQETATDPRRAFIHALADYSADNQIVITCREKDYSEIRERLTLQGAVTLQPLSNAQIATYLDEHQYLWSAIQADAALGEMARNPLLLSLLAYAYSGMGEQALQLHNLYHSPSELREVIFKTYVERRYEREQMRLNIPLAYSLPQIYEILGQVSMHVLGNPSRIREQWAAEGETESDLHRAVFRQVLKSEADDFVELMQRLHFLLVTKEGNLRFTHLLLRDYFTFLFCFRHLTDIDEFIRSQAAWALGTVGDGRAVAPLMAVFTADEHIVRDAARDALMKIGTSSVEPLIAVLADENAAVRASAAWALGEIGDNRAVEPLLPLVKDEAVEVRRLAIRALGMFSDERIVGVLIEAFGDTDKAVQNHAVDGLERIGGMAVSSLVEALRSDESQVRRLAAETLGGIRDAVSVPPLVMLLADRDVRVRDRAEWSLMRFGEKALPVLKAAVHNSNVEVRKGVRKLLDKMRYDINKPSKQEQIKEERRKSRRYKPR